jgi:hypothetical protein
MKLLVATVLAILALTASGAAAAPSFVVRGDRSFAGIDFRDTLASAGKTLGKPTRVAKAGMSCTATWRRHGLVVEFFAFEPDNPCTRGTLLSATMTGTRWHTLNGLRIGDAVGVLQRKFPRATLHPDGWWLVARKHCELAGFSPYGSLIGRVRNGKVSAFRFQGAVCE